MPENYTCNAMSLVLFLSDPNARIAGSLNGARKLRQYLQIFSQGAPIMTQGSERGLALRTLSPSNYDAVTCSRANRDWRVNVGDRDSRGNAVSADECHSVKSNKFLSGAS